MAKDLNIGMIGYGFMGRCHSNAFRTAPNFFDLPRRPVLKAACGRDAAKTQAFADRWGYESVETDWRKLIERPDIDLVDICVPNDLHAEIAIAAAEAGKMVITEKPLARTTAEGEAMVAAVEKAGVPNLVCYNYRRMPGRHPHQADRRLRQARPHLPLPRQVPAGLDHLARRAAGRRRAPGASTSRRPAPASPATSSPTASTPRSGSTAPIASLTAMTETFVKERTHADTGKVQPVGIDDAAAVLTRFANGSLGTFESTRYARGHKALYTLEINGEHGSLAWDLHDLNRVAWFDHRVEGALRGWTSILVTDGEHPYLGKWWVPGLIIGFEHSFVHTMADFIAAHGHRHPRRPDLPRRARDHPRLRRHHRLGPVASMAEPLTPLTSSASPHIRAGEVHGPRMRPCP